MQFSSGEQYPLNLQIVKHSDRTYHCPWPQCNQAYAWKCKVLKHYRLHTRNISLRCTICQICFRTESAIRRHIRTHEDGSKPLCGLCFRLYATMDDLLEHYKQTHQYTCPQPNCTKAFKNKHSLDGHLESHAEAKYSCSMCNVRIRNRPNVVTHMKFCHGN